LAEIKQRFPNLPVMMVTAYGDDERRRRARELGAFEFIPKPVDFDQLKVQLRQLANRGDGLRERRGERTDAADDAMVVGCCIFFWGPAPCRGIGLPAEWDG
jgi:DNA-binding NtrC family response regulator